MRAQGRIFLCIVLLLAMAAGGDAKVRVRVCVQQKQQPSQKRQLCAAG
jgi:hypothetical protein